MPHRLIHTAHTRPAHIRAPSHPLPPTPIHPHPPPPTFEFLQPPCPTSPHPTHNIQSDHFTCSYKPPGEGSGASGATP
jgi:hypothetical protein